MMRSRTATIVSTATSVSATGDDVDDVAFSGGHRMRLGVGLPAGLEHVAGGGAQQFAEARASVRLADRPPKIGGRVGETRKAGIGTGSSRRRRHDSVPRQIFRISSVRWIMRRVAPMTLMLAS